VGVKILIGTLKPGHQAPGQGAVDVTLEPGRARLAIDGEILMTTAMGYWIDPADLSLCTLGVVQWYRADGTERMEKVGPGRHAPTGYETMAMPAGAVGVVVGYDVDAWLFPGFTAPGHQAALDYSDEYLSVGVSGVAYDDRALQIVVTWATVGIEASDAPVILMKKAEDDLFLRLRNRQKSQGPRKKDVKPERVAAHKSAWLADPRHRGSLRGWQTAAQLDLGVDRKTLISYLALADPK
jgi:hypothetical protein